MAIDMVVIVTLAAVMFQLNILLLHKIKSTPILPRRSNSLSLTGFMYCIDCCIKSGVNFTIFTFLKPTTSLTTTTDQHIPRKFTIRECQRSRSDVIRAPLFPLYSVTDTKWPTPVPRVSSARKYAIIAPIYTYYTTLLPLVHKNCTK
jgi:hypothetical protein